RRRRTLSEPGGPRHGGAARRGLRGVPGPRVPDRRERAGAAVRQRGGGADVLQGLRVGRTPGGLRLLRPYAGPHAVDHAAAVRDLAGRAGRRRRVVRRRQPAAAARAIHQRRTAAPADAVAGPRRLHHRCARQLRLSPERCDVVAGGVRRHRTAGAPLRRWRRPDHRRIAGIHACGGPRGGSGDGVRRGVSSERRDPIATARANWERSGWGDVADGMVAVTSVMRAHQILLARVETALRPYDLSFSRFELLRLLAFTRTGELPITKASDRLQVHVTSVTHAIRRLEAAGLVERIPHPTDGRTTLVRITELGRSTVEDATVT